MISTYMKERMERKLGIKPPLQTKADPKPIPKKSAKRKEEDKDYKKLQRSFLREKPFCEATLPGCQKASFDVHHKRGRGKYLLDVSTWIAVCRNCHTTIEQEPKQSKEKGLSESRLIVHESINGSTVKVIDKV